jgi:predicted nucleic acid-binding protein
VIILDSSFLVAFHNRRDIHHGRAAAAMERLLNGDWGAALLPEYVFLEVATVIAAKVGPGESVGVGKVLLDAADLEFVSCSDYFNESFDVFRDQQDTTLSFVDASIVAIARRLGAAYVATFDQDFAGVANLTVVP